MPANSPAAATHFRISLRMRFSPRRPADLWSRAGRPPAQHHERSASHFLGYSHHFRTHRPTIPFAPLQRAVPPCKIGGPSPPLQSAETSTSFVSHAAVSVLTSKARMPATPGGPAGPGGPASPRGPCGPGGPASPFSPTMPGDPAGPVAPISPRGPGGARLTLFTRCPYRSRRTSPKCP